MQAGVLQHFPWGPCANRVIQWAPGAAGATLPPPRAGLGREGGAGRMRILSSALVPYYFSSPARGNKQCVGGRRPQALPLDSNLPNWQFGENNTDLPCRFVRQVPSRSHPACSESIVEQLIQCCHLWGGTGAPLGWGVQQQCIPCRP